MELSAALSIYTPANRRRLLVVAAAMVVLVAAIDWWTKPTFRWAFSTVPDHDCRGFLSRPQIVSLAVLCAFLQEEFSNLPAGDAWPRLILSSAGFVGTGLFIYELLRNRRIALSHLNEFETQVQARREAEEQLQVLVESSRGHRHPGCGWNDPAGQRSRPGDAGIRRTGLAGQNTRAYIPALFSAVQSRVWKNFRTTLQCKGHRSNGEVFLAGVWFSTYSSNSGNRLAAIFVDLSEDLRSART